MDSRDASASKNMLIDSLPEGFKYRVKKLKISEKSDVKEVSSSDTGKYL